MLFSLRQQILPQSYPSQPGMPDLGHPQTPGYPSNYRQPQPTWFMSTGRPSGDDDQVPPPPSFVTVTSVTSLRLEVSNTSTKRKLGTEDFASFLDAEVVHEAINHLTNLTSEQIDNLAVQNKSGQEVVGRAKFLIDKLQKTVDKALDSAFSAGVLSSGSQNSEYPGGRIPTNRSRDQILGMSQSSIYTRTVRANNLIKSALQVFNDINNETTEQQDESDDKTAIEQWLTNDPNLSEAVFKYFELVENKLTQSKQIADEVVRLHQAARNK